MFNRSSERGHPCFDKLAHFRIGRIHLPVAPKCNISCNYCQREINSSENRPGVAGRIILPKQALLRTVKAIKRDTSIQIVGIAGPGDSLVNEETFETLMLIDKRLPHLKKCISTNGLLLADRIPDLLSVGVDSISVTINALDPEIGRRFYSSVRYEGQKYRKEGFDLLIKKQIEGIEKASAAGISVKVNSVLVPDLNGSHLIEVAKAVKISGAVIMNIMPLKPLGKTKKWRSPNCFELEEARFHAEKIIEQFRLCQQCRADAVGIPGKSLAENLDLTPVYHY